MLAPNPFSTKFKSKIDISPELSVDLVLNFLPLIDVLNEW